MKKALLLGFAIILLLLDWIALDDIITGNEPLLGEYLAVIISVPVLVVVGYFLFRKKSHES